MFLSPVDVGTDGFTDGVTDVVGQKVEPDVFASLLSSLAFFPGRADLVKNSFKPACLAERFLEADSPIKLAWLLLGDFWRLVFDFLESILIFPKIIYN